MSIPKPQTRSSSDIELPVLTSHAQSIQPAAERVPFSSPISEANSIAMVDEVEPTTPAYFPPSNDIPAIQSSDAGVLEYTQLHGHSEIPLSSRQREDDWTSVHASEANAAEALPAYRADIPPRYSLRLGQNDSSEPLTWPAISFRIGFRKLLLLQSERIFSEFTISPCAFGSFSTFLVIWSSYVNHTSRLNGSNIYALV